MLNKFQHTTGENMYFKLNLVIAEWIIIKTARVLTQVNLISISASSQRLCGNFAIQAINTFSRAITQELTIFHVIDFNKSCESFFNN